MSSQTRAQSLKRAGLASLLLLSFAMPVESQQAATLASSNESSFEWEAPDLDVELTLEATRTRDYESNLTFTKLESEIVVKARQQLSDSVLVRGDLSLEIDSYSEALGDEGTSETLYSFEQLYIQQLNAGKTNRWRLGRQSVEDEMGWIIDEDLDGLRFTNKHESRQFDLSFSRQQWMTLGNEERDDEIDNVLGQLTFEGRKNTTWSPYILFRKDRGFDGSRPSENTWFGIQGIVRLNSHLLYWVNAAARDGHEERKDGKRALGGNAVDAGITWARKTRFEPSFTLGYAQASGDTDVSNSENDTFRQSGLHSNKFRLNGRNRFRYLGEVVDPELSNINIMTVGAGVRLSKRWELDIAFHRYAQQQTEDSLRGSDIDFDPAGVDGELGDEIDLVIGYSHKKKLEVQGLFGLFKPGSAFEDAEDAPDPLRDVWLTRLEIEYEF